MFENGQEERKAVPGKRLPSCVSGIYSVKSPGLKKFKATDFVLKQFDTL
jgi:hypothetical protein